MKMLKPFINLRSLELQIPDGVDGALALAYMKAFEQNAIGVQVASVAGTAIGGSLSGANKIFTRTTGFDWIKSQVLKVGAITVAAFTVGEAVTQATSSAAGVILSVEAGGDYSYVTIGTITVAVFDATHEITGSTSGAKATPTAVTTNLVNLIGWWVYAHVSGNTANGAFVRVATQTAYNILTTDEAMPAAATAIILFPDEIAVRAALDLVSSSGAANLMKAEAATTATYVMTDNGVSERVVIADTGSNDVLITLPDIRTVDMNQQIMIYGKDATTNSIDVQSYNAAQTLDGTDISSGGTPLATIDADDDYIIIQRNGLVWTTVQDGIS